MYGNFHKGACPYFFNPSHCIVYVWFFVKAYCESWTCKTSRRSVGSSICVVMSSVSSRVELYSGIPLFLSRHNNNDGRSNLFSDRRDQSSETPGPHREHPDRGHPILSTIYSDLRSRQGGKRKGAEEWRYVFCCINIQTSNGHFEDSAKNGQTDKRTPHKNHR